MRYRNIPCPHCDAGHQSLLSRETDRHLRNCPNCDAWYLIEEAGGDDDATDLTFEVLGNPAECPVEGCTSTFVGDDLTEHILEHHDGSLAPDA